MAELLEAAQEQKRHEVPDVEAVGGGIEPGVDTDAALVEPCPQLLTVGRIVQQTAGDEVFEDVGGFHSVQLSPITRSESSPIHSPTGARERGGQQ